MPANPGTVKPASRPEPILPNESKGPLRSSGLFMFSVRPLWRRRRVEELDTVDTERTNCRLPLRSRQPTDKRPAPNCIYVPMPQRVNENDAVWIEQPAVSRH